MTIAGETTDAVGSCWECGYALRGLETPRCPECGRPFDPNDPASMNMGRRLPGLAQALMRPPGWPLYSLTVVAAGVSFWAAETARGRRHPVDLLTELALLGPSLWWDRHVTWLGWGDSDWRFLLASSLWAIVLAVWVVRRAARGVTVRRVSKRPAAAFAYWARWITVPAAFGATVFWCWVMPGGFVRGLLGF